MAKEIKDIPALALSELSYDRFLLRPGYMSRGASELFDLSAPLVRYRKGEESAIKLHIAVATSPMQAVFSPALNVELAKMGGLSISNCSQPIEAQAAQRRQVRNKKAGFVTPVVVKPDMLIEDLYRLSEESCFSTFPVTEDGTLDTPMVGLITANDYDIGRHGKLPVHRRMMERSKVVVADYSLIGEDLKVADDFLRESHHGSVPVLLPDGRIKYMVFRKDIEAHRQNPHALVDHEKRYMGGDAINTRDYMERVPALVEAGASFLYITTKNSQKDFVRETLEWVMKNYPGVPVGAGNVATPEGFMDLAEWGAACVGVGIGPGSICITREKTGSGVPQGTAVQEVAKHGRDKYFLMTGTYIPIIGDGGFSTALHFVVGYVLGADIIMSGRMFAGTDESPTKTDFHRRPPANPYWGEASPRAQEWMEGRYGHSSFAEGVEDWVEYVGPVRPYLEEVLAAAKEGLWNGGHKNIREAYENGVLISMTEAAKKEGGAHSLIQHR